MYFYNVNSILMFKIGREGLAREGILVLQEVPTYKKQTCKKLQSAFKREYSLIYKKLNSLFSRRWFLISKKEMRICLLLYRITLHMIFILIQEFVWYFIVQLPLFKRYHI